MTLKLEDLKVGDVLTYIGTASSKAVKYTVDYVGEEFVIVSFNYENKRKESAIPMNYLDSYNKEPKSYGWFNFRLYEADSDTIQIDNGIGWTSKEEAIAERATYHTYIGEPIEIIE